MMTSAELETAVRERRVVELRYQGDPGSEPRVIYPHALYITSTGKECIDAYQVAGPSRSGSLPEWRDFNLAKIVQVRTLDEHFELAPGYNPGSAKYRHGLRTGA
jgi:predicted DNA-binding transcriptional regulator YafY